MRSAKKRQAATYRRMKPQELRDVTKRFDEEMIINKSRAPTTAERSAWRGPAGSRADLAGAPA